MTIRFAKLATSERLQRIANLLGDGDEYSTLEIINKAGVVAVNSAITELRRNGLNIICSRRKSRNGGTHYVYRQILPDPPPNSNDDPLERNRPADD